MAFGKKSGQGRAPASLTAMPSGDDAGPQAQSVDAATIAEITAWPKASQETPRQFAPHARRANFTMTFAARGVILFAAIYFLVRNMMASGDINQLLAFVIFAMVADLLRVVRKALRHP